MVSSPQPTIRNHPMRPGRGWIWVPTCLFIRVALRAQLHSMVVGVLKQIEIKMESNIFRSGSKIASWYIYNLNRWTYWHQYMYHLWIYWDPINMELSVSRAPILTVEVVPTLPPHVTGTGVALITGAAAGLWSFGVGHRGIPKIHGHLKRNHSHDGSGYGAAFFLCQCVPWIYLQQKTPVMFA